MSHSYRTPTRRSTLQVLALPLIIAFAGLAGLIVGLTGEGVRDVLAWLFLSALPAAIAAAWLRGAFLSR